MHHYRMPHGTRQDHPHRTFPTIEPCRTIHLGQLTLLGCRSISHYRETSPDCMDNGPMEHGSSQCLRSGRFVIGSERAQQQCCAQAHRPSAHKRSHPLCQDGQSIPCTASRGRSAGHQSQSCSRSGIGCNGSLQDRPGQ